MSISGVTVRGDGDDVEKLRIIQETGSAEKPTKRQIVEKESELTPPSSYGGGGDDDDVAANTDGHHPSCRNMSAVAWLFVSASMLTSVFLFALDNTVVVNIQPSIVRTLGNIEKLPWIAVGFGLGTIASTIVWGRLFDLFDSKKLYCVAIALFEIGSALCGAAPSFDSLIVGRVIAGVGGAGIYIGTLNIYARLTSLRERPLYLAFIGAVWSAGTILGPIIGGAFADSTATWRWAFYINLCIAAPAAPAYLFLLPSQKPRPDETMIQLLRQVDFVGAVVFAGAATTLIMGINFGGTVYSWRSGQVIGLFVCAGVLWAFFAVQQTFSLFTTPTNRIFPVKFLKSLQISILAAQIAVCTGCIFIMLYMTPLYYQYLRGETAVRSGVLLLPLCCVAVVGAIINALCLAKVGFYMPWFLVGGIMITVADSLVHELALDTPYSRFIGYGVLHAFGAGLFLQAPYAIAQAKVAKEDVIHVTAFLTCGQISGIAIAVSIASSIFINLATTRLAHAFPYFPPAQIQMAIQGGNTKLLDSLPAKLKRQVLEILMETIDDTFVMTIVGGILIIIMSLMMKRERIEIPSILDALPLAFRSH